MHFPGGVTPGSQPAVAAGAASVCPKVSGARRAVALSSLHISPPGLVCIPTAACGPVSIRMPIPARGTWDLCPHRTPLPECLQLSEARTWAGNSGSSGTPQSLFPALHCLGPGSLE